MQPPVEGVQLPDFDLLRPRLAQLINSISTLTSHLVHALHASPPTSTVPPTLPFPDLLNRYSLLISQFNSLVGLISSQGDLERERDRPHDGPTASSTTKRRRDERDTKRDKWAGVAVVPREPVEESKDWIVGLLLRTKQTPEVEARQAKLVEDLPSEFKQSLSSSNSAEFAHLVAAQTRLFNSAYDRVNAAKEFSADGGEEWDWKGRVGLEDEGDDEDGDRDEDDDVRMQVDSGENGKKGNEEVGPRAWTEQETATYLRTGTRPMV